MQGVRKLSVLVTMTKNASANLFRSGTGWLIVLFLPPLLVRVLDKPSYGTWMLLLQLGAYITMLDGGIQTAVARFVARADHQQDHSYLPSFLSSVGVFMSLAAVLTLLLAVIAAWWFPYIFRDIPGSILSMAREALLVIGTSMAITLPFSVIAGFYMGHQRYEVSALAGSAGKFTGALGVAWAAYHHQGLLLMAVWVAVGNLVQCLTYAWFWRQGDRRALLHPSFAQRTLVREFVVFCSAMVVSQFSSILITGMDMPIVAAFDFRTAAYYGIATTLSNILVVPFGAVVNTLIPVAAGASIVNDPLKLGEMLYKATRFSTALLCLIILPLVMLMPVLLRLWVGQDYATQSQSLALILIAAQFIRLTMLPYGIIGFAAGQQQKMLVSPLAEGVTNLLFSLVLVQLIGARGVAIGTLIGAAVAVVLHFTVSLPRTDCVDVSRRRLFLGGIVRPSVMALPLVCLVIAVPHISSIVLQVLLTLSAEFGLLVLFWIRIFDPAERKQLAHVIRHFVAIPMKISTAHEI